MNVNESPTPSTLHFGNGLSARLHLSVLPSAFRSQESTIRNRWYDLNPTISTETNIILTDLQTERGWL